jgi:hypothetical protein
LVFLVLVIFVLLVLLLLLLLALAEFQVVASLVVRWVQAQTLLVGFNSLSIHLVTLADDTHVVEGLRLAQLIGFNLGSFLKLRNSR